MADEVKKLEVDDLPARAKVIGEEEAEGVFGGAKRVKRGGKKRKPRKPGKKMGKKTGKKGKKRGGKKRPKIGGGGKKRL
jgi:hypothetical protein